MSNNKQETHFLVENIINFRRREAAVSCPLCQQSGFQSRQKLQDHAKKEHPEVARHGPDGKEWKDFPRTTNETQVTTRRTMEPRKQMKRESSNESIKNNVGDESQTPASRSTSVQDDSRSPTHRIPEIQNLSIQSSTGAHLESPGRNLKRPATRDPTLAQLANPIERASPRSTHVGHASVLRSPSEGHARPSRKGGPPLLYNPEHDGTTYRSKVKDTILTQRRGKHPRLPVGDDTMVSTANASENEDPPVSQGLETEREGLAPQVRSPADRSETTDLSMDAEPELLLQPETRPVPYDQLVDEIKGIYGGLIMVEAKCIEVDEKQTVAVQERDPARPAKLTAEQYSALIALHKTLLNEHHDFFLACQHPSATTAVKRLPAKYSMPARMWRHAIHAFLEVLRFRLPDSLDHMLAFIYIAYSMMALLYETVPLFEDTWIECLGDLGRYRMAIEDDDIRDRENWSGVARSWYRKAVDRSPKTGRLNHHLAILARPYTIDQLSLYSRALTCVAPFVSARTSIMSQLTPILEGRDSQRLRSTSVEICFIKAIGLLFTGERSEDYQACVDHLIVQGHLDKSMSHMGSRFREGMGAFTAASCIAALLEFGATRTDGSAASVLRLAYDKERARLDPPKPKNTSSQVGALSSDEAQKSKNNIKQAAALAFGVLRVGLQRPNDPNVFPMLHVFFAFIHSLCKTAGAMDLMEEYIPWLDMEQFLSSLASMKTPGEVVCSEQFPASKNGKPDRPVWEDFLLDGQIYAMSYYPDTYPSSAAVDLEEKDRDAPSMIEIRDLRVRWLGHRLALDNRYLDYNSELNLYTTTERAKELCARNPQSVLQYNTSNQTVPRSTDAPMPDAVMPDSSQTNATGHAPLRATQKEAVEAHKTAPPTLPHEKPRIMNRESKRDVVMTDVSPTKSEPAIVSPDDEFHLTMPMDPAIF